MRYDLRNPGNSSSVLTLLRRRLAGRFGGLQALQSPFFFRCCGGYASAAPEKGDSGEAAPPQPPPLRNVSSVGYFCPGGAKQPTEEEKYHNKNFNVHLAQSARPSAAPR